jgi:hypothetical protein
MGETGSALSHVESHRPEARQHIITVTAAHAYGATTLQHEPETAVAFGRDLSHVIQIHNRRPMRADEARAIESLLEIAQRLTNELRFSGAVDAYVVAVGFDAFDPLLVEHENAGTVITR